MANASEASSTSAVSAITLDGPSIRLRPITRADYGFMWQCRTHPEILYLWLQDRTLPSFEHYTQELEGALSGKILTTLLIETRNGSAPVGYVFAYDFSAFDHTAFISIVIPPTYVQYGWAAEACILFLNYLFTFFDLRKASMDVFAFNQIALEPLLRVGARVEGRFRGQRYYQGAYHDIVRMAIMRDEWERIAPTLAATLAQSASRADEQQGNDAQGVPGAPEEPSARRVGTARRKGRRHVGDAPGASETETRKDGDVGAPQTSHS